MFFYFFIFLRAHAGLVGKALDSRSEGTGLRLAVAKHRCETVKAPSVCKLHRGCNVSHAFI